MFDRILNGIFYLYRDVLNRKVVVFNLWFVFLILVVGYYWMRKLGMKMIRGLFFV